MVSPSASKDKSQTLKAAFGFSLSKYSWNTILRQILVSEVPSTYYSASNKEYIVLISCAKGRIPTIGNRKDQKGIVMYRRNNKFAKGL